MVSNSNMRLSGMLRAINTNKGAPTATPGAGGGAFVAHLPFCRCQMGIVCADVSHHGLSFCGVCSAAVFAARKLQRIGDDGCCLRASRF